MMDGVSQISLPTVVWILVFLAAFLLEWTRLRLLSVVLLGSGYLLAFIAGLVDWRAGIVLALLLAVAYATAPRQPQALRVAGHVVFVAVALGLGLHVLPGFHNLRPIGPVQITPDAVPFTMYLNLDKPLAGFWLLLVWPALCLRRNGWSGIGRGLLIAAVTAVVCLGLGVALGKLDFAPKWPHLGWLWALNNLLLVCLTEEALFRGYLQEGLTRRFSERAYGEALAVGIAAVLFGIAHAAGGVAYVIVAGLAGVGYGLAYRAGGLQAAILAHFGLNLSHFTLFTYPMLAS